MVKSDNRMGDSQLLGARARAPPKVYAYALNNNHYKYYVMRTRNLKEAIAKRGIMPNWPIFV